MSESQQRRIEVEVGAMIVGDDSSQILVVRYEPDGPWCAPSWPLTFGAQDWASDAETAAARVGATVMPGLPLDQVSSHVDYDDDQPVRHRVRVWVYCDLEGFSHGPAGLPLGIVERSWINPGEQAFEGLLEPLLAQAI